MIAGLLLVSGITSRLPAQEVFLIKDFNSISGISGNSSINLFDTTFKDSAYLTAWIRDWHGPDIHYLYRTDGTPEGTFPIRNMESVVSSPLGTAGQRLILSSTGKDNRVRNIYSTDELGGASVTLISSSYTEEIPTNTETLEIGDLLYFSFAYTDHDYSLWRTDGTKNGTFRLKTVDPLHRPNNQLSRTPRGLTQVGDLLYFGMTDEQGVEALWKTDGTVAGTVPVRQVNLHLPESSHWPEDAEPYDWVAIKMAAGTDRLFFVADDGVHGNELWMSDGHVSNTRMVKDILVPQDYGIEDLFGVGPFVYFWVRRYGGSRELWRSDGLQSNTVRIDALDGLELRWFGGNHDREYIVLEDRVFFSANDGIHGFEPWVSDLTRAGTRMVADLSTGFYPPDPTDPDAPLFPASTAPTWLTPYRHGVLFITHKDAFPRRSAVYWTDGTAAGTHLVHTFQGSNGGGRMVPVGDQVFLAAVDDPEIGRELYGIRGDPPPPGEGWLKNLSTRGRVGTGDEAMIAGFIVKGGRLPVLIRGIGPSLAAFGILGVMNDPQLQLYSGATPIASNDDWRDSQEAEILATGKAPGDNRESAIVIELDEGAYTAIMTGVGGTTGIGLVEINDLLPK